MCEWRPDFEELNRKFEAFTKNGEGMEQRLTKVEHDVGQMRLEAQDNFRELNRSLSCLAHDMGERMTTMDKRLVEEKQKWGECLRRIVEWTVRVMLTGCAVAMGVTAYKQFIT